MSITKIKSSCSGCSVCANICPVNAIEMKPDEFGFLYPSINSTLCTGCKICEKKCPVLTPLHTQNLQKAYYGRTLDKDIVAKSSSGGIFTVLAQYVIDNDGVVFGAVFDKNTKTVIFGNTDNYDIDELRRSKYVESHPHSVYSDIKKQLENNRMVLFCGMPCQVAALKKYLNKEHINLYTCDFICGGGSSAQYFIEHLKSLSKKYKSEVKAVNFRPKLYGWKEHSIKIDFFNGKSYKNYAYLDTYFRGFVNEQITIRESCTNCKFRNNHASDIIMADFWGYRQIPGLDIDDKGMSLIVSNSEKGECLIHNAEKNRVSITEIDLKYTMYNFKPKHSSERLSKKRREFKENYLKYGFEKAAKKTYMTKCIKYKIKKTIKRIVKGICI